MTETLIIKEPRPDQETTASSSSRVSKKTKSARQEEIQEKAEKRREQLAKHFSGLSSIIYTAQWRKIIGDSGYPLLNILATGASWRGEHIWKGNVGELAVLIGVNEKTVRNQLNKLKRIEDFKVVRYPHSLAIHLPDRIYSPSVKKKTNEYLHK